MPTTSGLIRPITRSRTLSWVAVYALLFGAYAVLPVWNDRDSLSDLVRTPSDIHAALALVLGWLLVFRTNTAYKRWWEARTLWGQLVNTCRNLAQKFCMLVDLPSESLSKLRRDLIAYPFALRDHLRSESRLQNVPGYEHATESPSHIPSFLVARLYRQVRLAKRQQRIDGDEMRALDEELRQLLIVCGGCERIYRTRVVRSYRVFARQCVMLFLVTFPWGISNDFGWWTIPLAIITAYFMIGLETVAEHVEEPFGRDEDDLDLDELCLTIDQTVSEIFSDPSQLEQESPVAPPAAS